MNVRWLRSNRILIALLIATVLTAGLLAVVVVRQYQDEQAGNRPMYLEAAEDPGLNPFVPVTGDKAEVGNGEAVQPSVPGSPPDSPRINDQATCDPERLISYLATHPAEASAWAQALNSDPSLTWSGGKQISLAQIPTYIRELTPQLLPDDLRVTNHRFEKGKPVAVQSVLQKGTAVLSDKSGVSRVRCACGNPLKPMAQLSRPPTYAGKPWSDRTPIKVVIIDRDRRCDSGEYFDGRHCRPTHSCPPGQYLAPNNRCYHPPDVCPLPLLGSNDGRCYYPPDQCPPAQIPGPNGCHVPPCQPGEKSGSDRRCAPPETPCQPGEKSGPDGSCVAPSTQCPRNQVPGPGGICQCPSGQQDLAGGGCRSVSPAGSGPAAGQMPSDPAPDMTDPPAEEMPQPVQEQPVQEQLAETRPAAGQDLTGPEACVDLDSDEACKVPTPGS
ncbi:MAG: DUF6777 domain-containing protein [Pseudonocardiaceae bacterium]